MPELRSLLSDRLRAILANPAETALVEGDLPDLRSHGDIPAAVLIAVTDRADPGVILTVRREHMRTHAGQIAFPGGRIDPGESPVQAALREANEELLMDPGRVDVLGELETYRTVTGYVVTPVLGVIPSDLPLAPHEHEVAEWFEAPLVHLLDPANQHIRSVLLRGAQRHYYEIEWNGRRIWGATAAMIVNLSRRVPREVWR